MTPINFPEANVDVGPPKGMDESQVHAVRAFHGAVTEGTLDGSTYLVVAWKPTEREIEDIKVHGIIYLTVLGGLPPHFLSTRFENSMI